MKKEISFLNKPIVFDISNRACKQLAKRQAPLCVSLELQFGCMVVKRVFFKEGDEIEKEALPVIDNLLFSFNANKPDTCSLEQGQARPRVAVVKQKSFTPKWCKIDFRKGDWVSEFGY